MVLHWRFHVSQSHRCMFQMRLATVVDGYSAVYALSSLSSSRQASPTHVPLPTFHGPVSSTGH